MIIKNAEYIKDYKIKLLFSDGVAKIVDFEPFLNSTREIIAPLLDIEYFKGFYVDEITICWPNGLDFAPELLHKVGVDYQERKKRGNPRIRVQRKSTVYALTKKRPRNDNK